METYSFTYSDEHGVMTSLSFIVPAVGAHIMSFHEMSRRAALAFGWAEHSVDNTFGESFDDAFVEFETSSHLVRE